MASIDSLPTEILIEIVDIALGSLEEDTFGKIGCDAAWDMPRANNLDAVLIQASRPHTPIEQKTESPEEATSEDSKAQETEDEREVRITRYTVAKSLLLYVSLSSNL
jgi:hypothetical protein